MRAEGKEAWEEACEVLEYVGSGVMRRFARCCYRVKYAAVWRGVKHVR